MRKILLILTVILVGLLLNAQEKIITGKVTTLNELPVVNVSIEVKSTKMKFFSDTLGLFSVKCSPGDRLSFFAEGFIPKRVRISSDSEDIMVNLTLKSGSNAKEIATGYGHVKDKDKLYAVSSMKSDDINYSAYRNIFEVLMGTFPGVKVNGGKVVVRGGSSGALLIVDGSEVSDEVFSGIHPIDIARISVLKDASASIYGARGGNGVVIVETKRGGR